MTSHRTPTQETYSDLQAAYDHFNTTLFAGELPSCLITLQRKNRRVMGYYSPGRFKHRVDDDRKTDEIAMNPMHFLAADDMEALQTLAHEMCHLWQHHFGKPSRGGYHNREWSDKMQAVGLMPSSTGAPGGKTVGQRMADYPIAGSFFETEARKLMDGGFRLSWYEAGSPPPALTPAGTGSNEAGDEGDDESPDQEAEPQSGKRMKFTCPKCNANTWGKKTLQIMCVPCEVVFESAS